MSETQEWRCFFCSEVFTDRAAAADHFGVEQDGLADEPGCRLNKTEAGILGMLREARAELQKYHEEDDAQTRVFYSLGSDHAAALLREEEKGYARGLADGKALAVSETTRATDALAWAVRTFGSVALDPRERAMRFVEEAIELAHAVGLERTVAGAIFNRIYNQDRGLIEQEFGQAQLTLECLGVVMKVDPLAESTREFERIQSVPQAEWDRRHAAKVALGIATHSVERSG